MNKKAWTMQASILQGTWSRISARFVIGTALLAASLSTSLWAQAQNAIQSVSGSVQGGSEVIRIDLAEALTAVPTGFTIQTPARIALDFPGSATRWGVRRLI